MSRISVYCWSVPPRRPRSGPWSTPTIRCSCRPATCRRGSPRRAGGAAGGNRTGRSRPCGASWTASRWPIGRPCGTRSGCPAGRSTSSTSWAAAPEMDCCASSPPTPAGCRSRPDRPRRPRSATSWCRRGPSASPVPIFARCAISSGVRTRSPGTSRAATRSGGRRLRKCSGGARNLGNNAVIWPMWPAIPSSDRRMVSVTSEGEEQMNRIAVAVLGNDQITREGAVSRLTTFQEIEVLPPDQHKRAEVILILAGQLSDGVLFTMERCGRDNTTTRRPSIVLVANEFREDRVLRAIKFGLVSLLYRQDSGYERIVQAILSAYAGRAELPNSVLRYVLDQLKAIQNNVLAPRGLTVAGLSDREVDVFRLLAEGFDTAEVALKLNYSERTVKNVIHGAVTRLKLRNRTHAVAYALRSGVL